MEFAHAKKSEAGQSTALKHSPVSSQTPRGIQLGTLLRKSSCSCGGGCPSCPSKASGLKISQPTDAAEIEADQIADRITQEPQGARSHVEAQANSQTLLPKRTQYTGGASEKAVGAGITNRINSFRGSGAQLDSQTRDLIETRLGTVDLSRVRIHAGSAASDLSGSLSAAAFTVGNDIFFGEGQYSPHTDRGRRLLAHELVHVHQQDANSQTAIQRTFGDGHDLTSPRFSRLMDLEAAYDAEGVVEVGDSGRGVQAVQQALYDLGHTLPTFGADGTFSSETRTAVEEFQRANPPLVDDGRVGRDTMTALDARFGTPVLPPPVDRAAPWTAACVQSILCPWSPHTVDVLSSRITLVAYDSISWADEEWDGAAWIPSPFPGAGYNTGTEIGVLNSSCESMAETLYHEVLHAEQPSSHATTRAREAYAYRIGEEFSIAMGLGGRPALRQTDAHGRVFASRTQVASLVAGYPGVSTGAPTEEVIGRGVTLGDVEVRRPDGTIYTRAAAVGEKVPGPRTTVPDPGVTHPTAGWVCP